MIAARPHRHHRARLGIAGWVFVAIALASACARQAEPAELDAANTACHFCRMQVSDVHFAAQIAAPGAEPQFFDDLGCLRDYLRQATTTLPPRAVAFVADHRTGAWVRASRAVYTRPAHLETPMGGGLIAHATEESRRQDPAAEGGRPMSSADVFGPAGPPDGERR